MPNFESTKTKFSNIRPSQDQSQQEIPYFPGQDQVPALRNQQMDMLKDCPEPSRDRFQRIDQDSFDQSASNFFAISTTKMTEKNAVQYMDHIESAQQKNIASLQPETPTQITLIQTLINSDSNVGRNQSNYKIGNKLEFSNQDQNCSRTVGGNGKKEVYKGFLNSVKIIIKAYFLIYHPGLENQNLMKFGANNSKSNRQQLKKLFLDPQLTQIFPKIFKSKFIPRQSRNSSISRKFRRDFLRKYTLLQKSFIAGEFVNLS